MTVHVRSLAVWAAVLGMFASTRAGASFPTLAERLPPAANAMIAINAERVLNSAVGSPGTELEFAL